MYSFVWRSNTLGKHQLKDLGKLAHKTWTAWGVLHVACRMSTRLLRNIPVYFAFRNWISWLNALEIRLNTQTTVKRRRKWATQQMGRTRKRCEGHATHKKAANEEVKNSRAVTGGVSVCFFVITLRTKSVSPSLTSLQHFARQTPTRLAVHIDEYPLVNIQKQWKITIFNRSMICFYGPFSSSQTVNL